MSIVERAARYHLEDLVEELVDDPHGFGPADEIRKVMEHAQSLARELNASFDDLFKEHLEDESNLSYAMKRFLELERTLGLNWSGRNS